MILEPLGMLFGRKMGRMFTLPDDLFFEQADPMNSDPIYLCNPIYPSSLINHNRRCQVPHVMFIGCSSISLIQLCDLRLISILFDSFS
ncbi:hypothetical protein Hdeb2414_s0018g00516941 [Helianthus debilis subsp. tardiflorus]